MRIPRIISAPYVTRSHLGSWPLLLCLLACPVVAQRTPPPPDQPSPSAPEQRVPLDRVVAVVNNDLILESDVDAEERFAAFEPIHADHPDGRSQIIDRLIDRDLILQQMSDEQQSPVADDQVDSQLAVLRKDIPQCAAYHCETDAGWLKFCADHGFTPDEVRERWRDRMSVLRFIEQRFRMGIRISPADIHAYYISKLVPAYQKEKVTPPPESSISNRIQEVLLQQQVTGLLDDWLKSLRAQGRVRIMDPSDNPVEAPK